MLNLCITRSHPQVPVNLNKKKNNSKKSKKEKRNWDLSASYSENPLVFFLVEYKDIQK